MIKLTAETSGSSYVRETQSRMDRRFIVFDPMMTDQQDTKLVRDESEKIFFDI